MHQSRDELHRAYIQHRRLEEGQPWYGDLLLAAAGLFLFSWFSSGVARLLGEAEVPVLYTALIALLGFVGGVRCALWSLATALLWGYLELPGPRDEHHVLEGAMLLLRCAMGALLGIVGYRLRQMQAESRVRELENALLFRMGEHLSTQASRRDLVLSIEGLLRASFVDLECSVALPPDDGAGPALPERLPEPARQRVCSLLATTGPHGQKDVEEVIEQGVLEPPDTWSVCLALRSARDLEGVLWVQTLSARLHRHGLARILPRLLHFVAVSLENHRLRADAAQAAGLREAERLKSHVLRSVSHELKTPLASVTAIVTSLLDRDQVLRAEVVREDLQFAAGALERLNEGITSLLELSRLEARAWEPDRQPYELGEIIGTVRKRLPKELLARLRVQVPESLPPISVDFTQWLRLLQNLLENAHAYAPSGWIELGAQRVGDRVQLWVQDHGPGIPAKDRERIFDKFYRGSTSASRPSGTGIGLTVCQEIVAYHGGSIAVASECVEGARLIVEVPCTSLREEGRSGAEQEDDGAPERAGGADPALACPQVGVGASYEGSQAP